MYTPSMQAMKSLGMLRKYSIKCSGFPVTVAIELFDKTTLPIMIYVSEIWAIHIQGDRRCSGIFL